MISFIIPKFIQRKKGEEMNPGPFYIFTAERAVLDPISN